MGAGGTAGAVSFPAFIEDIHGHLLASTGVDTAGGSVFEDQNFDKPDQSVINLLNTAWGNNPYITFEFTDPGVELEENREFFDLYFSAVTGYDFEDYGNYVEKALLAVTGASQTIDELAVSLATSAPSSPQGLFTNFATTTRNEIEKFLTLGHTEGQADVEILLASAASTALGETTLTASTTLWNTIISAATNQLKKCDFPKQVSVPALINFAAANAKHTLEDALKIVRSVVDGTIVAGLVTAFEGRREITFQSQISQYAATMADVNAVNSSAFLFGTALIRAEQMREVADFEAQLSFQVLQQGLSHYIQTHSAQLRVGAQVEAANASAHNALLQASIQLMSDLHLREEITPRDLLAIYRDLFQAELSSFTSLSLGGLGQQDSLYRANIRRDQVNHGLNLEAARINKTAKEQRYIQGLSQVLNILTNEVEFRRLATSLITEQNIRAISARSAFEGLEIEDLEREQLWDLNAARMGIEILAAPSGMASVVPKQPHPALQVAGVLTQGIAAVGSVSGGGGG